MKFFDKNPRWFQILTIILSLFFFIIIINSFFRYISSPTDENLFITTPSLLCFNKDISAELLKSNKKNIPNLIRNGDLLLSIKNKYVKNIQKANDILVDSSDKTLLFEIYRPSENQKYFYKVINTDTIKDSIKMIHQTVTIINITKNGASDRAGLKKGDMIYNINGENFKTDIEADIILRKSYTDKPIIYKLYRNNELMTVHVVLARYGIQIFQLIYFLSGLIFVITGIFISLKLPLNKASRLIGTSFLLLGYTITILYIRRDPSNDFFVIIRNLSLMIAYVLGISFMIHSLLYFPKKRPELISKKKLLFIPYTLMFLYIILQMFIPGNLPFNLYLFSQISFILIIIFFHRKYRSQEYIKLIRHIRRAYILLGISFFFIAILNRFVLFIPIQGLFLIPIPIAYLYTIGRYELYNADFRIKRNVQYSIAISIWYLIMSLLFIKILIYLSATQMEIPNIVFTGRSIEILKTPLSQNKFQFFENGILMVSAIFLGSLFWKMSRIGKRIIDRKFYRSEYDYKRVSNIISKVMANKLNALELSESLVEELAVLMHFKAVGVLFFEEDNTCRYHAVYGNERDPWIEFCSGNLKNLRQNIEKYPKQSAFDIDELAENSISKLRKFGFKKIIGIYSKERLIGLLLIGEKLSETLFYPEDTEILVLTAKQVAIAIENILLYEELAEQERIKHELNIARQIQLSTLPQKMPNVKGLDLSGSSIPAKEVGGDYYDFLENRADEITIIVGDVSGKGMSAAFYQSKIQGVFRSLNGFNLSLKDLFVKANTILCNDLDLKVFVTAVGTQFFPQKQKLILTRAGHMPLFHYDKKKNKINTFIPKGLGLGMDNKGKFQNLLEEKKILYNTGDVFLFVSDGITEARDINSNEFGEDRLKDLLLKLNKGTSSDIKESIIEQIKLFSKNAVQHDDQTIVVVKAV